MGYETYLVGIIVRNNKDRELFVSSLLKLGFTLTENKQDIYLEKEYPSGIIELLVTKKNITFRYAKPNLKTSLKKFLEEIEPLCREYGLTLFDYISKKEYNAENLFCIVEAFDNSRREYSRFYKVDKYPIKSEDVFNNEIFKLQ